MESDNKLFLLDAYALIYRAYYAFIKNPRINSKGFNTSAILGFVNTLEEVLKKENPSHIGVAFDPSGPTFRHEAFEQYKAQREETPEAIRLSVPIIKDIIHAYRIPILEVAGYEADDVIGTLATEAGRQGITTYMMTPDKDYGQLVTDNVFMYRPKHTGGFEVMGIEEVKAKFDIQSPAQVIDMLGLMGDASDNIPGCPGVGEKTAQKLIAEFGSIENLLEHTDQLKGALKTKVETNKELITFSKFLATIKIDVPIQLEMDKLVREQADEDSLRQIFEELEFRTLIDRVLKKENSAGGVTMATGSKTATAKSAPSPLPLFPEEGGAIQGDLFANFTGNEAGEAKKSNLETLETLNCDYQLIDTEKKRAEIIQKLLTSKILSLDTETTGTEPMDAELVGMSFSITENQAFYVPVPDNREEALKIVNKFRPVFENENSLKVGQNIKYDMIVLENYGVQVKGALFDTMIAHYVLQPELRHGMDYLAEIYLHYQTIHIDELIGPKGKNQKNMRDLDPKDIYRYACEDADVTLKLKNVLEKELKENDAERLFYDIEMPLVPVLVNIERNGVLLDTEALKQSSVHFTAQMQRIEQEIYELAGQYAAEAVKEKLRLYEDELLPLYKLYSLETILSRTLNKKVWLKSGGYLVIEQTEALTAVDVNSGKMVKKKDSFLKTNLEAAEELVRQIGLCCCAGFIDDFAQLTAAKMFRKSQGEFYDMVHGLQTQIGGNTESAQMGAHQPGDVHQYRNDRKQHRHPAVVGQILRAAEIRSNFQHFTHDLPDKIIWHECNQCADCGEDPGRIGQISVTSRNHEQT